MTKNEVEIKISPNGEEVNVHVQGVKGKGCIETSKFLEEGLGLVDGRTLTNEYHQQPEKKVVNVGFNKG